MGESDKVPATTGNVRGGEATTIRLAGFDRGVKVVKELGVPICLAAILLWSHFTVMQKLVANLERSNIMMERVEKVLWRNENRLGLEPTRNP